MISHKHRCIFVHIPKNAGTSIELKIAGRPHRGRGKQDHRTVRNIQSGFVPQGFAEIFSIASLRLLNQRLIGLRRGFQFVNRSQFDEYFKFTFVRNPWARAYSWYRNVMRDRYHLREHGIRGEISFEEFLREHSASWALRSQVDWLTAWNGEIPLDFIGRFENLQSDFDRVCQRLGIQDSLLSHELQSRSGSYVDAYNSTTKRIVESLYERDIEVFEYEFEK